MDLKKLLLLLFFVFFSLLFLFPSDTSLEGKRLTKVSITLLNPLLEARFLEVDTKSSDKDLIIDLLDLNRDLLNENDRNLLIMQNYEHSLKKMSDDLVFCRFSFVVLMVATITTSIIYIFSSS